MSDEILGIDLGASSIKLSALALWKDGYELTGVGIVANPVGKVTPSSNDEKTRLASAIKSVVKSAQTGSGKIRIGLAESQVFTRVIQLPILSEAELGSAIQWEAEQHIPVPLSEVQLDYSVISRPPKGVREGLMEVLLVAAKKTIIGNLVDLVNLTDLELVGIEPGLLGVVRALSGPKDPPTMIMHLGASSSDFAVVSEGRISLTYSVPTGGASLTRSIEVELGLSTVQSEQYKRAYGLNPQVIEGKVRAALLPVFKSITAEARKVVNSFESTRRNRKIQRILLSGGTAFLPGISSEIASELGTAEVIIGNPFYGIRAKAGIAIPAEHSVYSVAVGLAKGTG